MTTCLWVIPEDLGEDSSLAYAQQACETASYILWAFSGRRYSCPTTVTERYECPCYAAESYQGNTAYVPIYANGLLYNIRAGSCTCRDQQRLRLRGRPVTSVHEVLIGGVAVDRSLYRILNGSILEIDQPLSVSDVTVTYTYGASIPSAGRVAARTLAMELVKSFQADDTCRLPDRVTSVARQGVSYTILDSQDFLEQMRTSLYEVDLFLKAANPSKAIKPAKVFSVDRRSALRVTSGATSSDTLGPLDIKVEPARALSWTVKISDMPSSLLATGRWLPLLQINNRTGAVLYPNDPAHFTIAGDNLTISLSAGETRADQLVLNTNYDLYAQSTTDPNTLVHLYNARMVSTRG